MRIIRLTASDTRQALRAVREQLGEEAVILTSKRTGEGVEVTAASDLDAAQLQNQTNPPVVETIQTAAAAASALPTVAFAPETALPPAGADFPSHTAPPTAAMDSMSVELRILRHMLESQLEQLAWNERTRRTPVLTEMLRELTEMGILAELAERITEQLPEGVISPARGVSRSRLSHSTCRSAHPAGSRRAAAWR